MREHQIEASNCRGSKGRDLSPSLRFVGSVAFVIWVAFIPVGAWGAYAAAAAVLALCGALIRVSFRRILRAFFYFEAFVLCIALLSLFQSGGLTVFFSLITRSSLCVLCMTMLSCSTSFSELLSIGKRFGIPSLLSATLALTYRYSFLLVEEAERLRRARKSRTFQASRSELWKLLAGDIAQLFLRSYRRSERVYSAMCARGWQP